MMKWTMAWACVAAGMMLAGCASKEMACCEEPAMEGKVRHVVLFQWKDSATPQQIESVVAAFHELPGKIDLIKGYEHGHSQSVEGLNAELDHAFVLTFDSFEDLRAYIDHPSHKEFVTKLRPVLERPVVVDYVVKGG